MLGSPGLLPLSDHREACRAGSGFTKEKDEEKMKKKMKIFHDPFMYPW